MEELKELDVRAMKIRVIKAGEVAVDELIKVAEKPLLDGMNITSDGINPEEDEITADKLTRAAQAKKMAIMDAFEILSKIEMEHNNLQALDNPGNTPATNFAERLGKTPGKK